MTIAISHFCLLKIELDVGGRVYQNQKLKLNDEFIYE
jgi:hypothetical protein